MEGLAHVNETSDEMFGHAVVVGDSSHLPDRGQVLVQMDLGEQNGIWVVVES